MSCVPREDGVDVMRAMGRWSEETEDGVKSHACHGRVEE